MSAVRGFPPVSSIDLPYEGPSARDARCWVRGLLAGRVDEETIEAVVVCFSELVTNSQVHTRPSLDRKEITCRLRITTAIRGEVIDAGSPGEAPTARRVRATDEAGRGLSQVVNGYADAWGYELSSLHEGMTWFSVHPGTRRDRVRREMPAVAGRREVLEHACAPECVPAGEHPGPAERAVGRRRRG